MKILVTGGAGFIGSNLVTALLERDYDVVVMDNLSTGKKLNLPRYSGNERLRLINADIRDQSDIEDCIDGSDVIVHLAAMGAVARSIEYPVKTNEVNVDGTLRVLEQARKSGVGRIIFAGSSSVLAGPYGPTSPYGVTKLAAEKYMNVYAQIHDMQTITLRFFNIFGPQQSPFSPYAAVIARFIDICTKGMPIPIDGDGEQTRDFTYVENAVNAILLSIDVEAVHGEAINIGCGVATSINEVAKTVHHAINGRRSEPNIARMATRAGDAKDSCASIEAAERLIGYKPIVYIEEGIRRTAKWWNSQEGETWRSNRI